MSWTPGELRPQHRCEFHGGPHDGRTLYLTDIGGLLETKGPPLGVHVGHDYSGIPLRPGEAADARSTWVSEGWYRRVLVERAELHPPMAGRPAVEGEPVWRYDWAPAGWTPDAAV